MCHYDMYVKVANNNKRSYDDDIVYLHCTRDYVQTKQFMPDSEGTRLRPVARSGLSLRCCHVHWLSSLVRLELNFSRRLALTTVSYIRPNSRQGRRTEFLKTRSGPKTTILFNFFIQYLFRSAANAVQYCKRSYTSLCDCERRPSKPKPRDQGLEF